VIGNEAFYASKIKFFDFTDELRRIESFAFAQAQLLEPDATNSYIFGNNLYYMGDMAFNQALNFNGNSVTFALPATLKTMGYYALSNFKYPSVNSTITIGTPGEGSDLDLSIAPGAGTGGYRRISDNDTSLFPVISFYSAIYHSSDDTVTIETTKEIYTVG
jgi:hypothetical protein